MFITIVFGFIYGLVLLNILGRTRLRVIIMSERQFNMLAFGAAIPGIVMAFVMGGSLEAFMICAGNWVGFVVAMIIYFKPYSLPKRAQPREPTDK